MSIQAQAWVYQHSEARLADRLVLLAIADEADDDGTGGYPGLRRIADKARVSRSTAHRCVENLEASGELLVKRPETTGRGRYNEYVVLMGRDAATVSAEVGWADRSEDRTLETSRNVPDSPAEEGTDPLTHQPQEITREEPLTLIAEEPREEDLEVYAREFATWWTLYPRKITKRNALKAWIARRREGVSYDDLNAALDGYLAQIKADGTDERFILHPSTFLGPNERWKDYVDAELEYGGGDYEPETGATRLARLARMTPNERRFTDLSAEDWQRVDDWKAANP